MHLFQLSWLSLCTILGNLPSGSLFIVSQVCPRWYDLCCAKARRRRTLSLHLGDLPTDVKLLSPPTFRLPYRDRLLTDDGKSPLYPNSPDWSTREHSRYSLQLTESVLNQEFARQIVEFLPDINRLHVAVTTGPSTLEWLSSLLYHWHSTVQQLIITVRHPRVVESFRPRQKAFLPCDKEEADHQLAGNRLLLLAINSMPSLRHLTFDVNSRTLPLTETILDLPILLRLETFHWSSHDWAEYLYISLDEYGTPNDSLQAVHIDCPIYNQRQWRRFFVERADIWSRRFQHLHLRLVVPRQRLVLYRQEPTFALTTLRLRMSSQPETLASLLRYLEPLTSLVHFALQVNTSRLEAWSEEEEGEEEVPEGYRGPFLMEQDAIRGRPVPRAIPSIKVLTIDLRKSSPENHHLFGRLGVHLLFPNLQIIRLRALSADHLYCKDCQESKQCDYQWMYQSEPKEELPMKQLPTLADAQSCLSQLLSPLGQCAQLQLVEVSAQPLWKETLFLASQLTHS